MSVARKVQVFVSEKHIKGGPKMINNSVEEDYLQLLSDCLKSVNIVPTRPGIRASSLYGRSLTADLSKGFPLLTTKKVHFKSVAAELCWMLDGDTNVKSLQSQGVTIWDEWADAQGELGPVYGAQWRSWEVDLGCYIDQVSAVLTTLAQEPHSRRNLVSAWNMADVNFMALPPCHMTWQVHVDASKRLHMSVYMRSADIFLGVPFNLASYALLTHILAEKFSCGIGSVTLHFGDLHLYENHREAAQLQLSRQPYVLPQLSIVNKTTDDLKNMKWDWFKINNYKHHTAITAEVAK